MGQETHIVRFKIVSIKCSAIPEGQQYTVYYRRGDTSRSTPCYIAKGGTVDFSSMPEGAAVIHFKSGHGGRRFAAKYVQFRVEEYTRGAPRRTVGETEVDCSLACTNNSSQGGRVLAVNFRMYGVEAVMRVAMLVYPERSPALSFDNLITPSSAPEAKPEEPPAEVKFMGRGEAMTLLISLETMLERKKTEEAGGQVQPASKAEKRLKELEDLRKTLTGSEGMATRVVTTRCDDCIEAQFVALARKSRNNYIGATAAYLRQLALQSGVPLTGDDAAAESMDEDTMREQLNRTNRRLEELGREVKQLEEQQTALGRLQHKMDVTQELCANLDKITALEAQMKLLGQSKDALTQALRSRSDDASTPINREVKDINDRVKVLTGEREQLKAKVKHMTAIASGHVLSWARAKNPPEPVRPKTNVDDLFSDAAKPKKTAAEKDFDDAQRKQILSAFQGIKPSAPPATARSASGSSSSGHRTPRDIFSNADGLPSMGDFRNKPKKDEKKPAYQDPLKPAGLASNMFAAEPARAGGANNPPTRGEFSFGASANKRDEPEPVFDFAAIMRQADAALGGGSSQGGGGGGGGGGGRGGFSFEPTAPSAFTEMPATQPPISFGSPASSPEVKMFSNDHQLPPSATPVVAAAAPSAPAAAVRNAKNDDPYYDDIDDYTIPPDTAGGAVTVEFDDNNFTFGVGDDDGSKPQTTPAPAGTHGAPAPRPTFNFGPSDDAGGTDTFGSGQPAAAFTIDGAPSFSFGAEDTSAASANNRGRTSSQFTNLPTYNFGS